MMQTKGTGPFFGNAAIESPLDIPRKMDPSPSSAPKSISHGGSARAATRNPRFRIETQRRKGKPKRRMDRHFFAPLCEKRQEF